MTEQDWQRIRQDTERAIEHMKRIIEIAEIGKKKTHESKKQMEGDRE